MTAAETWSRDERGGKRLLRRTMPRGASLPQWRSWDLSIDRWRDLHTTAAVLQLEGERAAGKLHRVASAFLAGEAASC